MRFVLLSFLFFLSLSANSSDYYWTNYGNGHYSSAAAACPPTILLYSQNARFNIVKFTSPTSGACDYLYSGNNDGVFNSHYSYGGLSRLGDSCPISTTYNAMTGGCDAPLNKCAILKGTSFPSWKWRSASSMPASQISDDGCGAIISGVGICLSSVKGGFVCTGTATFTGDKLDLSPLGTAEPCSGLTCTSDNPQKETKDDPCSMIPAGSGFTCTATKSESDPGKGQCGTANGAWVCVENPKPSSTESKAVSNQTVVNNADGSTDVKTTTVTTTTNCQGVGNCTSSTSTTTTNGGTTSTGGAKPSSSTCVGPQCSTGGKVSDTAGTTDDPVSDEDKATFYPPGGNDHISFVAAPKTKGNFIKSEADWDLKIEKQKTELRQKMGNMAALFDPISKMGLSAGGGKLYCPPPVPIFGHDVDFCLDKYADSLSWIAQVFLLLCTIVSLFIVFG